jgi:hypothetical protein
MNDAMNVRMSILRLQVTRTQAYRKDLERTLIGYREPNPDGSNAGFPTQACHRIAIDHFTRRL